MGKGKAEQAGKQAMAQAGALVPVDVTDKVKTIIANSKPTATDKALVVEETQAQRTIGDNNLIKAYTAIVNFIKKSDLDRRHIALGIAVNDYCVERMKVGDVQAQTLAKIKEHIRELTGWNPAHGDSLRKIVDRGIRAGLVAFYAGTATTAAGSVVNFKGVCFDRDANGTMELMAPANVILPEVELLEKDENGKTKVTGTRVNEDTTKSVASVRSTDAMYQLAFGSKRAVKDAKDKAGELSMDDLFAEATLRIDGLIVKMGEAQYPAPETVDLLDTLAEVTMEFLEAYGRSDAAKHVAAARQNTKTVIAA